MKSSSYFIQKKRIKNYFVLSTIKQKRKDYDYQYKNAGFIDA